MKFQKTDFIKEYYSLWQMGLMIPDPQINSIYNVKFNYDGKNINEFSRVCLKARSINDALERTCYHVTYNTPYLPENVNLHAVYDDEDNLLWIDEPYYNIVQKKSEFRGMERREFLVRFGLTAATVLYGLRPFNSKAGTINLTLSSTASGFVSAGEQVYTTAGNYNWSVLAGVTSISCMGVAGGGAGYGGCGGGGGGTFVINNFTVVPGNGFTFVVGAGGIGQSTTSGGNTTGFGFTAYGGINGLGSGGAGGSAGTGGYSGGAGSYSGGGAGGYGGNGGSGGDGWVAYVAAGAGAGGSGSGMGSANAYAGAAGGSGGAGKGGTGGNGGGGGYGGGGGGSFGGAGGGMYAAGGGGANIYGIGTGSTGGNFNGPSIGSPGGGPGGGSAGQYNGGAGGGAGGLRIIWPGTSRQWPNNAS